MYKQNKLGQALWARSNFGVWYAAVGVVKMLHTDNKQKIRKLIQSPSKRIPQNWSGPIKLGPTCNIYFPSCFNIHNCGPSIAIHCFFQYHHSQAQLLPWKLGPTRLRSLSFLIRSLSSFQCCSKVPLVSLYLLSIFLVNNL